MSAVAPNKNGDNMPSVKEASAATAASAAASVAASAAASAAAAPAAPVVREKLGSGAYGCVFRPPLSNINDFGRVKNFPGQVTKLFVEKDEADKALRNSDRLYSIDPRVGIPIIKYNKTYKKRNIPAELRANCHIHPGNNMNANVYPVRMPFLGLSLFGLHNKPDERLRIRKLHPRIIFQNIRKLFETVDIYRKHRIIHGDIRQSNIMILPNGDMNVIDFDWLFQEDTFIQRYSGAGFYSSPLETSLWNKSYFVSGAHLPRAELNSTMSNYLNPYRASVFSLSYPIWLTITPQLDTALRDIHAKFMEAHADMDDRKRFREFQRLSIDTFDSFGLGQTLIYFLDSVLPGWGQSDRLEITRHMRLVQTEHGLSDAAIDPFITLLFRLYREVFVQLVHWNPLTRMRIAEALAKLDVFIGDMNTVLGTRGGGRKRRTRKN